MNELGVLQMGRRRTQRWVGAVWLLTVLLLAGSWYVERHPAQAFTNTWHNPHSSF